MFKKTIGLAVLSLICLDTFASAAGSFPEANTLRQDVRALYHCIEQQFSSTESAKHTDHPKLLYVQEATNASMTASKDHAGCMQLQLWPIDDDMHFFSDEPVRISGMTTVSHFMQVWQHQSDHLQFMPNVAIQALTQDAHGRWKGRYLSEAELSRPQYDVQHHSMTYMACPLSGNNLRPIKKMRHLTLFFDHFIPWPP